VVLVPALLEQVGDERDAAADREADSADDAGDDIGRPAHGVRGDVLEPVGGAHARTEPFR
jgi:hypothetical protein